MFAPSVSFRNSTGQPAASPLGSDSASHLFWQTPSQQSNILDNGQEEISPTSQWAPYSLGRRDVPPDIAKKVSSAGGFPHTTCTTNLAHREVHPQNSRQNGEVVPWTESSFINSATNTNRLLLQTVNGTAAAECIQHTDRVGRLG